MLMLNIIASGENLSSVARAKARKYRTKTITNPAELENAQNSGWTIDRRGKRSIRLKKAKSHAVELEDRVWLLLYRMGFTYMSGDGGAFLLVNPKDPKSPSTQVDVVAIDNEIALAVECKSSERVAKRQDFQQELAKHVSIRARFPLAISTQFPAEEKRPVVLAMFLSNIELSENDKKRAEQEHVVLFDDADLEYYEKLQSHIGPAAKYQLLADLLGGRIVPGLSIKVPAVRTKIGQKTWYTFSISPEKLLKISYVSHRSRGKASDINTAYQRMLEKARLNSIREYINDNGIFPTNIVVNLDKEKCRIEFHQIRQEADKADQEEGVVLGWLKIKPAYKSAWIIDGQHRLFAYSGHEKAAKSRVSVLAFEGLPDKEQADLFIDINHKQKSVKKSLLLELIGELRWDAENPSTWVTAISPSA